MENTSTKGIGLKYILAMLAIVASLLFSEFLVQQTLQNQRFDAAEINFSGRQRMLSQRMTKNVSLLKEAVTTEEEAAYLASLERDLADFQAAHYSLINGNVRLELVAETSEPVLLLFKEADAHYNDIQQIVSEILSTSYDTLATVPFEARKRLPALLKAEQAFVPIMEKVVRQYADEARENNDKISQLSRTFTIAIIALIFLQALFVFLPAIKRLQNAKAAITSSMELLTEQNTSQSALNNALKQQQLALEKNVATLERRNEELDQFTYIASHDLKTPLRAVSNLSVWIEAELEDYKNPEVAEHLQMMRERILRMENLINGVLDYASISKLQLKPEKVDAQKMMQAICEEEVSGKAVFTLKTQMPVFKTEAYLLEQVFRQLIKNAIEHNEGENRLVEISYHGIRENHVFCVNDNGPGIPAAFHEKVFQIFQTLKSKDEHQATGIGLSIAKKIVEEKGGKIWIDLNQVKGSSFWFTWPEVKKEG